MTLFSKMLVSLAMLLAAGSVFAGNETIVPVTQWKCTTDLMCATKVINAFIECDHLAATQEEVKVCNDWKSLAMKKCRVCTPIELSFSRPDLGRIN
jgi:hypothetical protein